MRVVCVANDPKALADHQRSRAAEFESDYPLTIGKSYAVLGMTIFENVFNFLVRDDWGAPCFAPADFFELVAAPIPDGWRFALRPGIRERPVVGAWWCDLGLPRTRRGSRTCWWAAGAGAGGSGSL